MSHIYRGGVPVPACPTCVRVPENVDGGDELASHGLVEATQHQLLDLPRTDLQPLVGDDLTALVKVHTWNMGQQGMYMCTLSGR